MGRLVTQQPNGKWALISTCTDSLVALDCTKEEILENLILRRIRELEADLKAMREAADTFFTDPDRLWDWKKAIQWEYLRNGNKTDTWKYIKENIDPTIDDIAAAMRFNEDGEWID